MEPEISLPSSQEPATGPSAEPDESTPYLIFLNSVNQLIFVMVKCGVFFEVRTEFLNNV
jgi:hypothetical protein